MRSTLSKTFLRQKSWSRSRPQRGPPPLPKGDRLENLKIVPEKSSPAQFQSECFGREELSEHRRHRLPLDQEAQRLLPLCGSRKQRRVERQVPLHAGSTDAF